MNFLTLFLKVNSDKRNKETYQQILDDLVKYIDFYFCSRNTLILYNIMQILRKQKSLDWEKYYDQIFTIIFRNLNNLLILDTIVAEENIVNTILPEEPIGIKSILKQIPDFLVHLLLPSTHQNYEKIWQYIERIFLLIDRVFDPNAKTDQCDSLLKLFKSVIRKFIKRYEQDQKVKYNIPDDISDEDSDVMDLDYNEEDYQIPIYEKYANNDKILIEGLQNNHNNHVNDVDKEFLLDERCKERFLNMIDKFLKKLIFMEDSGHASCKALMWLCYFEPRRYAVQILQFVNESFSHIDDMNMITIKNCMLFILPVLCDRKMCPQALKYIPDFLNNSFKLFEVQGLKENLDLIETYSKLFMTIPLKKYNDLLDEYQQENPNKSEQDFLDLLQEKEAEDINIGEIIKFLENFGLKLFKFIVDNIQNLEMPESDCCTLIIDFNNIFWTFITNSSHSLRVQYIDILFNKLENNILPECQQGIAFLLDCFSLTEPELLMEQTINLLQKKLLKPRTDLASIEKMKKNVMWYVLEKSENKDYIIQHEFAISNEQTIKFYICLLENAMSYSRSFLINHEKIIETIVFLCFFQDDVNVYEKSCDIIHTIILTLCYIYPKDVSYQNKSEVPQDNRKYQYMSYLGKTNLKKFQLEWYEPGIKEREMICKWMQKTLGVAIQFFEENYFSKHDKYRLLNYETEYKEMIDDMLFQNQSSENIIQTQKLQKDFYKILYIALASFSGSNVRIPFIMDTKVTMSGTRYQNYLEFYNNFQEKFMFQELKDTRNQLMDLCLKLPSLFHFTKTIQDSSLIEMYQYLTRECFGESYLIEEIKRSNEMLDGLITLNDYHKINIPQNRFTLITECLTYLSEKIDMYFFLNPFLGNQKLQLFNSFFIFSFHPLYLFKMSIRYDHDLNFENPEQNIYEQMHQKAFEIQNYYIFDQDLLRQTPNAIIERVQELFICNLRIDQLQRFPCCASNPEAFYHMFNTLEIYEKVDKKAWQTKIVEQIMRTLTVTYEDSYLFACLRKTNFQKCTLLPVKYENNEEYKKLREEIQIQRDSICKENAIQIKKEYLKILNKINKKLEDENVHWKTKVLCCLFAIYFLNIFEDFNNEEIIKFSSLAIKFASLTNNFHLSQLGRAILFRLLNIRKRREVKKIYQAQEERKLNEKKTLEEFLAYRFLKNGDKEKYIIKNKETGFFYDYEPLYEKKGYKLRENNVFEENLKKTIIDQKFCEQLIDSILEAKEIYTSDSEEQENQLLEFSQGEIFEQIQVLFNYMFDQDKKKNSLFSVNIKFNLYEFYCRLFKKIFQALGNDFFECSYKKIEQLSQEYDNLAKQRVVCLYLSGILKALIRIEGEDKQKYIDFAVRISIKCIDNCSQEIFRDWCLCLSLACQNNSYFVTQNYFSKVLQETFKINGLGKRFRYHKLLKIFLQYNQTWARPQALDALDMLINADNKDLKECDESIDLFAEILCSNIIIRINLQKLNEDDIIEGGIQQYIDNGTILQQEKDSGFENNKKIVQYIDQIFKKLQNAKDDETKKLYSHMTFKMLDCLSVKKQNDLFWSYFRPFFLYILDNKVIFIYYKFYQKIITKKPDNVNEIEILKVMSQNEYPKNIRRDIVGILHEKIQSENWVSRQKVLIFAKNFLYFEEYQENLVDVNPLIRQALLDKNHSVAQLAVDCLSDTLKIATEEEQNNIFIKYKQLAQIALPKDKHSDEYKKAYNSKIIGIQVLMALLLAFQDQIYGWTEEALKEIIHSKNLNHNIKKKVKEFISQYQKDRNDIIKFNNLDLSDKMKKQIKEIANSYNYYA